RGPRSRDRSRAGRIAPVAQGIEHRSPKAGVGRSNRLGGTREAAGHAATERPRPPARSIVAWASSRTSWSTSSRACACPPGGVAHGAQWIEHRSPKAGVGRSNRLGGTREAAGHAATERPRPQARSIVAWASSRTSWSTSSRACSCRRGGGDESGPRTGDRGRRGRGPAPCTAHPVIGGVTMSAVFVVTAYGGPEGQQLTQREVPAPRTGEIGIEVRAAGVNPADWKRREGAFGTGGRLPLAMGLEASGIVTAVGEGTEGFAVGDA